MILRLSLLLSLSGAVGIAACTPAPPPFTDADRAAVADSAKAVAHRIIDSSNRLDFPAAFRDYSTDPDARYVENGVLYPNLDSLKQSYAALSPILETLDNSVDAWDVTVLGPDAAVVTLPIHLTAKAKGRPKFSEQYVWSAVIERRRGAWKVIQSHESHQALAQLMAALVGPAPAGH